MEQERLILCDSESTVRCYTLSQNRVDLEADESLCAQRKLSTPQLMTVRETFHYLGEVPEYKSLTADRKSLDTSLQLSIPVLF